MKTIITSGENIVNFNKRSPMFKKSHLAIAIALSTSSMTSIAEEETNNSYTKEVYLEKIEVTGSRLEQASSATGILSSIKNIPQSISVLDRDLLDSFGVENAADALKLAPGIHVQQVESSRTFFNARGNTITNFQFDGVPVHFDSFFSEAAKDSVSFDRIEIVRGATGLLSGMGEPSAAVNFIRKKPKSDNNGFVKASVGSWDTYRVEADQSLVLDESGDIKARFAGAKEQGESYIALVEKDNVQLYGIVSYDISENTIANIGGEYTKSRPKGSTWGGLPLWHTDGTNTDFDQSQTTGAEWTRWDRDTSSVFVNLTHFFENDWSIRAEIENREDSMDGKLIYMTGLVHEPTGLGMQASSVTNYISDRELQSARVFASGSFEFLEREHKLMLGAIQTKQDIYAYSHIPLTPIEVGSFYEWDGSVEEPSFSTEKYGESTDKEKQTGIYFATQLSLTDDLNLTLGNRHTKYELNSVKQTVNTPYAGLVYQVTDQVSAYSSYTEIFSPQSARDINNNLLDAIIGNNIELGIKSSFLDDAMVVTAAIFKAEKDNVAQLDPNATEPLPGGAYPSIAVKGTNHKGYELDATGNLAENLTLNFSYSHVKSEYPDGRDFSTHLPKDQIKLSSIYDINHATSVGLVANWQSSTVTILPDNLNPLKPLGIDLKAEQDSYTLVDFMAKYEINDNLKLQLNINNLFDKKYYASTQWFYSGYYGAPRHAKLSINYAW
ncbi:MAG: TonB-dependent siderophore receptor [Colwellia sp.]|nr:TonB-dependent siderophore receptor [Colwellia sp.]